jgi:hypothetical protein
MAAGKKCGVQQKLLMDRVRLLLHTYTQQQAPPIQPPHPFHVVSASWWFCALEKSRILHTAIALAAPIVKTFLLKDLGNRSGFSQSHAREDHANWSQIHTPPSSVRSGPKCIPARASEVAGRAHRLDSPIEHHGGQGGVLSAVLSAVLFSAQFCAE